MILTTDNPHQVNTPPTTNQTTSFVWNQFTVDSKLASVVSHLKQFIGKSGYNSFAWKSTNVDPLVKRMEAGENSESLFNSVMALPSEPKPFAKGAEHNATNPPPQSQAAGASDNRQLDAKVVNPGINTTL